MANGYSKFADISGNNRHGRIPWNTGTTYFNAKLMDDGSNGLDSAANSRSLYAYDSSAGVVDLQADPGTNGFTLNFWIYTQGSMSTNPGTGFTDYRLFQLWDDHDPANAAWYIYAGTSSTSFGFWHPQAGVTPITHLTTSGWQMLSVVIDSVGGSSTVKTYVNGVLNATSGSPVTSKVSTAAWKRPVFSLGSRFRGTNKWDSSTLVWLDSGLGQFGLYLTALTPVELVALYDRMNA
tara:strand:- start:829 stop:1536 length:708 start_codon:yes stop_codon:yes gene_type:complete